MYGGRSREVARELAGERDRYELGTPPRVVARALARSLKLNSELLSDDRTNSDLENAGPRPRRPERADRFARGRLGDG